MKIFYQSAPQGMHYIRNNGTNDCIFNVHWLNIILLQQIVKDHSIFIGCTWHLGGNAKRSNNDIPIEYSTGNICISHIYC